MDAYAEVAEQSKGRPVWRLQDNWLSYREAKKFANTLRTASETKINIAEFTPPRNEAERAVLFATVNGEKITSGDVEDLLKPIVFDVQERVYKLRKDELDLSVNDTLLVQEAQKKRSPRMPCSMPRLSQKP